MRRIETLIVLLALGFYAWFLHRFGWADVLHYVRVAGWGLMLTVALEAVARAEKIRLNQLVARVAPKPATPI